MYLTALLLSVLQILSQYTRFNMVYETFVSQSIKFESLLIDLINREQATRIKLHIDSIKILSECNLITFILFVSLMTIFKKRKQE
jgi:hypothetical protein